MRTTNALLSLLLTVAPANWACAQETWQETVKEWLKDPEKAKMMGTQDGTLCNPVLTAVEDRVIADPQPVVAYPDPKIAEDCEQYRIAEPTSAPPDVIEQEGGPDTLRYERRTVTWFPRRQMDVIAIPPSVKLRVWTPADGSAPFKACYFKTTGLVYPDNNWQPAKGPSIELVLEDGRPRAFPAEYFVQKDCDYIRAIHYRTLMARRKAMADYEKARGLKYEPAPDNHGIQRGTPGTVWVDTPHWTFTCGQWKNTKPFWGGSGKNWIWNEKFRQWNYDFFEDVWCWYHASGFLKMPWELKEKQYTFRVRLNNAGVAGWEGWAAAGSDCFQLHPGAIRPGFFPSGIVHEFGHAIGMGWQNDAPFGLNGEGWPTYGEASASYVTQQFEPIDTAGWAQFCQTSFYELLEHGHHYVSWPFMELASRNPNFGPMYGIRAIHTRIAADISPYMVIMREGEKKGLWKNGVKGFGDLIGEMAARHVNWEYPYQRFFQSDRALYPHPQTILQPVPDRAGWFAPAPALVPGQYGYNIIRLVPQEGANEVEVDLQGLFESRKHSDWRATVVAVDQKNQARYSPMFNKGKQMLSIRPGDRLYLAVAATPLGYTPFNGFNPIYTKPFYPYEVSFRGCQPAREREWGSLTRQYPHRDAFPPDPSTAEGRAHIEQMEQFIRKADQELAAIDQRMQGPMFDSAYLNSLKTPWAGTRGEYQRRLANAKGGRHPNGGGWVAATAHADDTAYVGPHAFVLDRAKVTGNARITGHAMVIDDAVISENAQVGEFSLVGQKVAVSGNAHILGNASVLRSGDIRDNAVVRGTSDVAATSEAKGRDFALAGCVTIDCGAWLRGDHVYADGRIAGKADDLPDPKAATPAQPTGNNYLYANWEFKYPSESLLYDSFFNATGVLRGEPAFSTDGERTIASFDGQGQYAVAPWEVCSWPELTLDVMLRHQGGDDQRAFDFGTDARHVYLTARDGDGNVALVQVIDGRKRQITAPAIAANQWVRIRAEFSGGEARLYVDGKRVGAEKGWTMPRDLDPRDQEAANHIAAGRGGRAYFHGDIDFFRIYTKVHEDFAAIADRPAPEFKDMEKVILGPHQFFTTVQQWASEGEAKP